MPVIMGPPVREDPPTVTVATWLVFRELPVVNVEALTGMLTLMRRYLDTPLDTTGSSLAFSS